MATTPFEYGPLLDGSIRLLKIRRCNPVGLRPIYLELYTFGVDDVPAYKALSYVWGQQSTEDRYRLRCHNMDSDAEPSDADSSNTDLVRPSLACSGWFQVTPNLLEALPFVLDQWDGYIWIDALCINQRDEIEKSRIVAQMHNFFSEADEVLIWLGPAAEDSDRVIQLLKDIYVLYSDAGEDTDHDIQLSKDFIPHLGTGDITTDDDDEYKRCLLGGSEIERKLQEKLRTLLNPANTRMSQLVKAYGSTETDCVPPLPPHTLRGLIEHLFLSNSPDQSALPSSRDPIWSSFRALCSRDWLRRVWTVQEAILARKALVLCGRSTIPHNALETVLTSWMMNPELLWRGTTYLNPESSLNNEHKAVDPNLEAVMLILQEMRPCLREEQPFLRKEQPSLLQQNWQSFWRFLTAMRTRECALDEDRIYGLLALANDQVRCEIPVEYSSDPHKVSELYIRVHRSYLRAEGDALSHILRTAAGQGAQDGMPSWCTDWRQPQLQARIRTRSGRAQIPGLVASSTWRDVIPKTLHDPSVVEVLGCELCRVRSTFSQWNDPAQFARWIVTEASFRSSSDNSDSIAMLCRAIVGVMRLIEDDRVIDWHKEFSQTATFSPDQLDFPRGISDRLLPYALLMLDDGNLGISLRSSRQGDVAVIFSLTDALSTFGDSTYLVRPENEMDEHGNAYVSFVGALGCEDPREAALLTEVNAELDAHTQGNHPEMLKTVGSRLRMFNIK